jgi:hypothetical protein
VKAAPKVLAVEHIGARNIVVVALHEVASFAVMLCVSTNSALL